MPQGDRLNIKCQDDSLIIILCKILDFGSVNEIANHYYLLNVPAEKIHSLNPDPRIQADICADLIKRQADKLIKNWTSQLRLNGHPAVIAEILNELPNIKTLAEIEFFSQALQAFCKNCTTYSSGAALSLLARTYFQRWFSVSDYYIRQFNFNCDDIHPHLQAEFWHDPLYWIVFFKDIIEPAIQRSQIDAFSSQIEVLINSGLQGAEPADRVLFLGIAELLQNGNLSIASLNSLVNTHGVVRLSSSENLRAIYHGLGVYDLRVLDLERLPEPGRYERYLQDGRRITAKALKAANVGYLFAIAPARPAEQGEPDSGLARPSFGR